MRVEPDISMDADPATGMLVGETQTFPNGAYYDEYRIGGTSLSSPLLAGVIARADSAAGGPLGFVNPALYSLSGNTSAMYDIGPAGKQDQSRADFANSVDASQGFLYTHPDHRLRGAGAVLHLDRACSTRNVALNATPGYDNMTGLGAPAAGFVTAPGGRRERPLGGSGLRGAPLISAARPGGSVPRPPPSPRSWRLGVRLAAYLR